VLIVDDCAETREIYAACLRSAGFRTAQAENGLMALEKVREVHPAVVVLDYEMPLLDGGEAARRIKGDPRTTGIPLILVSSFPHDDDTCFEETLSKPCSPERLVGVVDASLARRRAAAR
jgi:CheY-like chemotaxis protein